MNVSFKRDLKEEMKNNSEESAGQLSREVKQIKFKVEILENKAAIMAREYKYQVKR